MVFYLVCFKGRDRKRVEEKERIGEEEREWIGLKNKNWDIKWVVKWNIKIDKIVFECVK